MALKYMTFDTYPGRSIEYLIAVCSINFSHCRKLCIKLFSMKVLSSAVINSAIINKVFASYITVKWNTTE
jgi:hypothetical protein